MEFTNNFLEIVSGTNNTITREYTEAVKDLKNKEKVMNYLKRFITNIEMMMKKQNLKDTRISSSKGNIKEFSGYKNIQSAIEFIDKQAPGIELMKDLKMILKKVEEYQPIYSKGYDKQSRLVMFEYENSVYMLVSGLSLVLANSIDLSVERYGIKVKKIKSTRSTKITHKLIQDLSSQLSHFKHKEYLEKLVESVDEKTSSVNESMTFTESLVIDTLDAIGALLDGTFRLGKLALSTIDAIKRSLFGIIPIMRSIIYLRYKMKADAVVSLQQQIEDLEKNIEQLQNRKDIDEKTKEEIIKKQKAFVEAYKKKSEKLMAQLLSAENSIEEDIEKSNDQIKNDKVKDDDFVLEAVQYIESISDNVNFNESAKGGDRKVKKQIKLKEVKQNRLDKANNLFGDIIDKLIDLNDKYEKWKNSNKAEKKKPDNEIKLNDNITKSIDNIIEEFKSLTEMDAIRLHRNESTSDPLSKRTSSKLGGIPYWPKDKKFPNVNGYDGLLLVQLNFDELPKLKGYPSTGILQIFTPPLPNYDIYNDDYLCIYHKNILSNDKLLDEVPISTLNLPDDIKEEYFIYNGYVVYLKGELIKDHGHYGIEDYQSTLEELLKKHLGDNYDEFLKDKKKYEKLLDNVTYPITDKIGGYPFYIQNDTLKKDMDEKALLINFDHGDSIQLGDFGVLNITIDKKVLNNLKFENKAYLYWDCY